MTRTRVCHIQLGPDITLGNEVKMLWEPGTRTLTIDAYGARVSVEIHRTDIPAAELRPQQDALGIEVWWQRDP